MDVDKAIIYAEREGFRALELDVYRAGSSGAAPGQASGAVSVPAGGPVAPRPLLVYVHGGGWRVSHRSRAPRETRPWERGFFERLTDAGFVVAAPDYRLSGEALFPAQRDDVVEALRWLAQHAAALGADAGRMYLWGASGGGNLAALAALVPDAPAVRGVVCWYPVTDLTALDRTAPDSFEAHLLGGPIGEHLDLAATASPVTHVRADAPPFLLQHGDADTWVPVDQSLRLAAALRAVGAPVELEVVPGGDHFFEGAADVEAIFRRAVAFLLAVDAAASTTD